MVEITTDNTFNIFKSKKFGYLGGSDFAVSDDGLTWSIIQHYTDLSLTNPSTALINGYYYIADDTGIRKTKDFNTFFDIDAKISDDKHSDLNNFEWFQDLNGSWYIKYNASTDTGTFTYYADFDETTDNFVNAFNQFVLPTGGASGLQYVRGKYYIWQSGDKLYRADNFTDKFEQVKTDIAGNVKHKKFSSVVSDNYLYVYFAVDGKTYARSSKATNLIHWSEPVEVDNVELGSYFYNPSAISVYPDHAKVTTFDKVLKVTANGFKQTVPISCMVPASLQVQWEQNSTYQISFTAFDDGSVSYTMLSKEAQVEFNGQNYIIKQAVEDASGGVDTKTITASHIYNEINRVRQRKTKTGTLTYSVQDVLSFYLDDKVANSFGFTWSVFGDFDKQQIENLGNSSGSDMLAKIIEQWPQAIICPDNKLIRVYTPEAFEKDYGGRIDYLYNSSDVKMTVDSTTITNQVKVFGKQIENTDDNATDNAPVKYYFEPFIVEDEDSIKQYGLHPMDDVSDERFTDKNAMQTFAKGQLSPNPAVSIEVTMEDNEVPYAGEKRHLIAKPLNLETDLTVIGYTWYPFDNAQKNSLSFANLPSSILKTQANINNRIRMVQLMAQQAINAAKTGTRNFVSPTDPMKNDNNDIRTGDIWTLPLLDKKTKSLVRSVNFESEDDSDTNETIYTDPEKMDKINVQFSIWNGSQWLELSNQRTTNKLNDNINSVASQVQEAQAGIATAVQQAQDAVDKADKASTDAGFATDTANTAKQVADSAKVDVTQAKSDSATALTNSKDAQDNANTAIAKAESTAAGFGKVEENASDALSSAMNAQSSASDAVVQATSAAADSKDAKQIAGAVSQNYKTLTDGSTMTIAELENGLATKLTKTDLDGYATQTWTQNQIKVSADGINSTLSSVKGTVDGHTTSINDLKADSSSFKSQFTAVNDTLGKQNTDIGTLQATSKELSSNFSSLNTDNTTNKNDISQLKQTATEVGSTLETVQTQVQNSAVGTNLIVQSDLKKGYINRGNGSVVDNSANFNSDYIATNGATIFTFSSPDYVFKGATNHTLAMYDSDKNYLGYQTMTSATQTLSKSNVAYIRFSINFNDEGGTSGGVSDWLASHRYKLEKGSVATDYSVNPKDTATVTALSKVDQKADSISSTVTNNKSDADTKFSNINQTIGGIQSTVKNKADSSAVTQLADDLTNRVSTNETNITQNAKDITSKASQTDVDTLTGKVKDDESSITQNAKDITSKVSSSDVQGMLDDGGYATQSWTGSQIKQSADEINSTVTSVSNKVDNFQIGGRNYIISSKLNSYAPYNTIPVATNDGKTITTTYVSETVTYLTIGISGFKPIGQYTISGKMTINGTPVTSATFNGGGVSTYNAPYTATDTCKIDDNGHFVFTETYQGRDSWLMYTPITGIKAGDVVVIENLKFEKGNKATDWSPAPEDTATVTSLSKVDQKADSISSTVTNNKSDADTKFTNINQTVSGIQSTVKDKADSSTVTQLSNVVDSKVSTKEYNSEITQLADDINLRVKKDDLISQINLASDNVLIQSGNGKGTLYLDADTVVFSGKPFIPSAAISSLDVDKITGGITRFVESAWNSISGSALTIDGDSLNVLSGKGGLSLNKRGINFVDINNGETIGRMSAMNWEGYPNQNGIVQELNYLGDYMGWSSQEVENGPYISKLVWYSSSLSQLLGIQQGWHMDDPVTLREVYATNDWHLNKKAIFFEDSGIRVWGDAGYVYFRNKANNGNVLRLSGSDSGVQTDGTLSVSGDLGATKGKTWLKQLSVSAGIEADGLNIKNYKHAIVPTSQGVTGVNAYETAEVYFGDIGEAKTGDNSEIKIEIEKIFSETVRTDIPYHVFVSSYADANVWVTDRTQNSFIVHSSKPNVDFSWEIKAKRRGFEKDRLEIVDNVSLDYWNTYQDAKEAGASEAVLKTYTDEAKDGDVIGNG